MVKRKRSTCRQPSAQRRQFVHRNAPGVRGCTQGHRTVLTLSRRLTAPLSRREIKGMCACANAQAKLAAVGASTEMITITTRCLYPPHEAVLTRRRHSRAASSSLPVVPPCAGLHTAVSKPCASNSSSVYTSMPALRFSAIAFLIFLSSALEAFFFLTILTVLPSPSTYSSASLACLTASLFADSSQSYEPFRLSVWFSKCHTSGHTWSTNCALCEMMTMPPSYALIASAMAPSESRSR
mmetsp:Transcript_21804/g.50133  ORF Transcript_21804/g.50133 Transcript_21804/m.50133 type:complete len:239 (-) Transcript_21804:1338-2054(-)